MQNDVRIGSLSSPSGFGGLPGLREPHGFQMLTSPMAVSCRGVGPRGHFQRKLLANWATGLGCWIASRLGVQVETLSIFRLATRRTGGAGGGRCGPPPPTARPSCREPPCHRFTQDLSYRSTEILTRRSTRQWLRQSQKQRCTTADCRVGSELSGAVSHVATSPPPATGP